MAYDSYLESPPSQRSWLKSLHPQGLRRVPAPVRIGTSIDTGAFGGLAIGASRRTLYEIS